MPIKNAIWCCTIKVDTVNSKSQYIEKEKQEARRDGSESTEIQHGIHRTLKGMMQQPAEKPGGKQSFLKTV
ncbi:MAG: hypothetical protein PUF15_05295 [Faecalibacterium prausnitzii]|nr:hypothetical protein [Faecalibacterium prausnitzii]